MGRDSHDLLAITTPVVLPVETNDAVLDVDEAVVGDGDVGRVAADVVEDMFGPGEGRLGLSHPLGLSKRRQIAPEGVRRAQALQVGEELQFAGCEDFFLQVLQKQPAEQAHFLHYLAPISRSNNGANVGRLSSSYMNSPINPSCFSENDNMDTSAQAFSFSTPSVSEAGLSG